MIFCLFTPTAHPACHPVSPSNHSPGACTKLACLCGSTKRGVPELGVVKRSCGRGTPTRTPIPSPSWLLSSFRPRARALHACSPSRPRSLALALHLSDVRSVFSSCRSLLSGLYRPEARSDTLLALSPLPRALTSRLSPLARAFASVPCRPRLRSPSEPPLSSSSFPPRVGSVCCSLTRSTHCAFSKLAFPVSKLRSLPPVKLVRRYNQVTTWPAHGCTVFLDCLFSAGSLSFSDSWRSPCCMCSCSAESSGPVVLRA